MIWASARRASIGVYFEFESQPNHKIEYTARLDMASINSIPRFMLISGYNMGSGIHFIRANVRARIGAIINIEIDDVSRQSGSLINRLTASAMGCSNPCEPTT